jgi:hypothetical protein
MKPEAKPSFLPAIQLGGDLKESSASPSTAAQAALVTALLQALRDRGVLSRDEIDDVLADAASRSEHGDPTRLIERGELEHQAKRSNRSAARHAPRCGAGISCGAARQSPLSMIGAAPGDGQ